MPAKGGGDASHELGRSIVAMLLKEPFYGHLLGGVVRRIGDQVPTAAVALTPRGPELIVNPDFFMNELNTQERVAVIKHEALHLVFRHLYRPLMKNGNAELFNIAADIVVNQHVAPWPLPDSAVRLSSFPDLGLKPDQTLEWYYEKLNRLHQAIRSSGLETATDSVDSANEPASANGGSPKSAEALRRILGPQRHSDHRFWASCGGSGFADSADSQNHGEEPALGEALRGALESDLERHLLRARDRTSAQQWGSMPVGIRAEISVVEQSRKSLVDWRRTLRLFAANGYRTRVAPTSKRMSKRFNTFPGIRIKREQRVAVVIDTSGSINADTLALFFSEIRGVWRTGAEVVVIECDAAVQQTYAYRGRLPESTKGGGGTAFDPAFEWLRDPRNGRFDACMYLTDGYGPAPEVQPRCPLMWVLTPDGHSGPHLKWGRMIQIGH